MSANHIHGGDIYRHQGVIDFSANCNPYGTPESVKKAVSEAMDLVCNYPDVECEELRKGLAEMEGVDIERIICGNGAADLIFSVALALKPQKALITGPTFAEYEQALNSVGCQPEKYILSEEKGFAIQDDFLSHITEDTDIVFLCNPNNPTGVLTEREFIIRVLDRCKECDAFLMLDECFLDFVEDGERYTLRGYLDRYDNLFILKAFTKKYAIAGVRLGYGFTSNMELIDRMQTVSQAWNVSSLAQAAGVACMKEQELAEKTIRENRKEKAYLKSEIEKTGCKTYASEANYIFFRGPKDLYEDCLSKGILIRNCSNYAGLENGYYRVAVKLHDDNRELVRVLNEIIK